MPIVHKVVGINLAVRVISVTVNVCIIEQWQVIMCFFPSPTRAIFHFDQFRNIRGLLHRNDLHQIAIGIFNGDGTFTTVLPIRISCNGEAQAYSFYKTISSLPKPESEYTTIHTDPVSIRSIWRSGDYLNMVLQLRVKDQEHELSFIENGIKENADGTQTLTLTLFHDRKNDVEGFDEKYYLSIPLWPYQGKLNKGDQIVLQLNTYQEGMTSRNYTY